jgi:hypothetical protein
MIDTSIFYAIDLDHTLFDTETFRIEYELLSPENRPSSLEHLISASGRKLLDELSTRQLPFGIITFGEPEHQRLKLQLTGLDEIPYMLADTPEKAAEMGRWKQKGGSFRLPAAFNAQISEVREIVLVDDKAAAFIGIPSGVRGYLYRPVGREVLDFQVGDVPSSVMTITDLLAILS